MSPQSTLKLVLLVALQAVGWYSTHAFVQPVLPSHPLGLTTQLSATKTTLTDETTWNIRFVLNGVPTEKGRKVDQIFSISAQFLEEEGYEPPQGILKQINNGPEPSSFQINKSRWQLSEDPEDRKDGLWIWGLFQTPLYPYLLLNLQTDAIPLPSGSDEDKDFIKPLQLYAQINHKRDDDIGVILEGAQLSARERETIKADPFGAATVDINNDVSIGTISIQAATSKVQA